MSRSYPGIGSRELGCLRDRSYNAFALGIHFFMFSMRFRVSGCVDRKAGVFEEEIAAMRCQTASAASGS